MIEGSRVTQASWTRKVTKDQRLPDATKEWTKGLFKAILLGHH